MLRMCLGYFWDIGKLCLLINPHALIKILEDIKKNLKYNKNFSLSLVYFLKTNFIYIYKSVSRLINNYPHLCPIFNQNLKHPA